MCLACAQAVIHILVVHKKAFVEQADPRKTVAVQQHSTAGYEINGEWRIIVTRLRGRDLKQARSPPAAERPDAGWLVGMEDRWRSQIGPGSAGSINQDSQRIGRECSVIVGEQNVLGAIRKRMLHPHVGAASKASIPLVRNDLDLGEAGTDPSD